MPNSLGTQTPEVIVHKSESHKLHQEFDNTVVISKGQLVKLDSTGKVVPIAADDDENVAIGYSIENSPANDKCTIATRGYGILKAQAQAALSPGPVQMKAFDTVTKLNQFATSSGQNKAIGWSLDAAASAGDIILVLIKD